MTNVINLEEQYDNERLEQLKANGNKWCPPKPKAFPYHLFPPEISTYIEEFSKSTGSIPAFTAIGVLACGSILAKDSSIETKPNYFDYSNLYLCVVGKPGASKSAPIAMPLKPLSKIQTAAFKKYNISYEAWKVKVIKAKGDEKKKLELEEPESPTMFAITDGSIEGFKDNLCNLHERGKGPCAIFQKDELKGFFGSMGQYKGGGGDEYELWLSLWQGYDMAPKLKSGPARICPDARATVLGGIQPKVMQEHFQDKSDGMFDRFIFAVDKRGAQRAVKTDYLPYESMKAYEQYILSVYKMQKPDNFSAMGGNIDQAFQEYYDWCYERGMKINHGAFKKWERNFHKILLILLVMWKRETVDIEITYKAIELMKYFVEHWIDSLGISKEDDEDNLKQMILDFIKEKSPVEERIVKRKRIFGRNVTIIDEIIGELEAEEKIFMTKSGGQNKKTLHYYPEFTC